MFNLVSRRDIVLRLFYGFIFLTIFAAGVRYGTSWDMPFAHALFMTTFLLGGVMYFNAQTQQPLANTLTHAAAFLAGVLVVSWLVYNDPTTGSGEFDTYDTLSYFGCYLIATLLFLVGTLFFGIETRITSYLGAISYSMYLFHIIVSETLSPFIVPSSPGSTVLVLALIIVASAIIHHVVEKPFIYLGGNVMKRWNAGKSASAQVAEPPYTKER